MKELFRTREGRHNGVWFFRDGKRVLESGVLDLLQSECDGDPSREGVVVYMSPEEYERHKKMPETYPPA